MSRESRGLSSPPPAAQGQWLLWQCPGTPAEVSDGQRIGPFATHGGQPGIPQDRLEGRGAGARGLSVTPGDKAEPQGRPTVHAALFVPTSWLGTARAGPLGGTRRPYLQKRSLGPGRASGREGRLRKPPRAPRRRAAFRADPPQRHEGAGHGERPRPVPLTPSGLSRGPSTTGGGGGAGHLLLQGPTPPAPRPLHLAPRPLLGLSSASPWPSSHFPGLPAGFPDTRVPQRPTPELAPRPACRLLNVPLA